MSRAGIRARGHGGNVARDQNHEPRRCRLAAAGSDIGDHRQGRGNNLLDDLFRRVQQTARRVEPNHDGGGVFPLSLLQPLRNDFDGEGMNDVLDVNLQNANSLRLTAHNRYGDHSCSLNP